MNWRCDPAAARGFTLLELLIVLAIMGMIVTLVVGGRPGGSTGVNLSTSAAGLAAALREARAQAIAEGRPVAMQLDLKTRRFGVGKALDRAWPEGLTVAMLTGRADVAAPGKGGIRFFPDGSSTGGRITIDSTAGRIVVGVDWLSGRVSIADRR